MEYRISAYSVEITFFIIANVLFFYKILESGIQDFILITTRGRLMNSKNFLNDIKVKHKLLLVYIICVVAPIIIINMVFYNNTVENVKLIYENHYRLSTERMAKLMEKDLNFIIAQANKINMDQQLYEMLDKEYENPLDFVDAYNSYFIPYIYLNGEVYHQISRMTIYTDNPTILNSAMVQKIDNTVRSSAWYKGVLSSLDKKYIWYDETEVKGDKSVITPVSIVQILNQFQGIDKYLKILKIDVYSGNILDIVRSERLRGQVLIFNNGDLIFASKNIENYYELNEYFSKNQSLLVESWVDRHFDWKIINIMDLQELEQALKEPKIRIIFLTLMSLFLSSFFIFLIYRSFYQRLNALSEHVSTLDEGDFTRPFPGIQGKDEIGSLIRAYNSMVRKIKLLITDVYEAKLEQAQIKLEKKQAELSALQNQINPHYLFNTLESIRMKSLEKGETETAEIIKNLARSFRRILSFQQDFITVADEVTNIREFLEIQKYRFGSEFEYELDIEGSALSVQIPKLIIQPFVENACIHGLEKSENPGKVYLQIKKEKQKLLCIIQDNGIGIKEEKLKMILDNLDSEESKGGKMIGIRNIYQRLKLYYGADFDLSIESIEGQGTTIKLLIPMEV